MTKESFKLHSIPKQSDKTAIVTGANTGLGFETAKAMARKDITVVLACRNLDKADAAKDKILSSFENATVSTMHLDLSKLDSVRKFSSEFHEKYDRLDYLINNAGVMMPPYQKTEDGFELQMGVNYFGHFLLTGLLLDLLEKGDESRIVTLSSLAHKWVDINFSDINFEKGYDKQKAYGQSKLACLMFAYELQRRLEKHGKTNIESLAAHPGISTTELSRYMPKFFMAIFGLFSPLISQKPEQGALPTLRAALDENAHGGEYYGPDGFKEYKGAPVKVDSSSASKNKQKAIKLWEVSENLTGYSYL